MITIALFNPRKGVGKTTIAYHLAHMLAKMGKRTLVVDLDPQADLTRRFLNDEIFNEPVLAKLFSGRTGHHPELSWESILTNGHRPAILTINEFIHLIPCENSFTFLEDAFIKAWNLSALKEPDAFRFFAVMGEPYRRLGEYSAAQICILDLGSSMGIFNKIHLLYADRIIIPLFPDFIGIEALAETGVYLSNARNEWAERCSNAPTDLLNLPYGLFETKNYITSLTNPNGKYLKAFKPMSTDKATVGFRREILGQSGTEKINLGEFHNYSSLEHLSIQAQKPYFALAPADGAIGAHQEAVRSAYSEIENITRNILAAVQLESSGVR